MRNWFSKVLGIFIINVNNLPECWSFQDTFFFVFLYVFCLHRAIKCKLNGAFDWLEGLFLRETESVFFNPAWSQTNEDKGKTLIHESKESKTCFLWDVVEIPIRSWNLFTNFSFWFPTKQKKKQTKMEKLEF